MRCVHWRLTAIVIMSGHYRNTADFANPGSEDEEQIQLSLALAISKFEAEHDQYSPSKYASAFEHIDDLRSQNQSKATSTQQLSTSKYDSNDAERASTSSTQQIVSTSKYDLNDVQRASTSKWHDSPSTPATQQQSVNVNPTSSKRKASLSPDNCSAPSHKRSKLSHFHSESSAEQRLRTDRFPCLSHLKSTLASFQNNSNSKQPEKTANQQNNSNDNEIAGCKDLKKRLQAVENERDLIKEKLSKAEKELDESRDQKSCKICWEESSEQAFVPCGHVCCCSDCVKRIKPKLCPICKRKFTSTKKVYWS